MSSICAWHHCLYVLQQIDYGPMFDLIASTCCGKYNVRSSFTSSLSTQFKEPYLQLLLGQDGAQ